MSNEITSQRGNEVISNSSTRYSLTRYSWRELRISEKGVVMPVRELFSQHPRLVAWFVLAVFMVPMLLWAAKDVGLLAGQLAALVISTILLAGLCAWIIGWE
jgi:hypothetical protein